VGSSIAYQLSLRREEIPDWHITVVERCEVACAASGKAGGFLALNWCDRNALGPLARKSFSMFPIIAERLPGIDYRRVDTLSVSASTRSKKGGGKRKGEDSLPAWLDGDVINDVSSLGDTRTTAQVHPAKYTRAMMEAAKEKGVTLRIGCVRGLEIGQGEKEGEGKETKKVIGVRVDNETLPADIVVIAMGPWSGLARQWLPTAPSVTGHKAHSIVLHPSSSSSPPPPSPSSSS